MIATGICCNSDSNIVCFHPHSKLGEHGQQQISTLPHYWSHKRVLWTPQYIKPEPHYSYCCTTWNVRNAINGWAIAQPWDLVWPCGVTTCMHACTHTHLKIVHSALRTSMASHVTAHTHTYYLKTTEYTHTHYTLPTYTTCTGLRGSPCLCRARSGSWNSSFSE